MSPSLLLLSGASPDELRSRCETAFSSIDDPANRHSSLADLQARLAVMTPLPHRAAVIAETVEEARLALRDLAAALPALGDDPHGRWYGGTVPESPQRVAFLYPGQGAQRVGDQRVLATYDPAFADRCEELVELSGVAGLEDLLVAGWPGKVDLAAVDPTAIHVTDAAQTALTVLGVAATELLARLGIRPDMAVGHSVGEFAALHAVDGLPAAEAVRLAAERGRIMRSLLGDGEFGMVALRCSGEQAAALAEGHPDVHPTCWNDGRQTVYGGTRENLESYADAVREAGIVATPIPAQGPFHTPLMAGSRDGFAAALADVPLGAPAARFISTVSGQQESDPDRIRRLLGDQVTAPVDFRGAAAQLLGQEPDVVIQLSGGESLIRMVRNDHPEASFLGVGFGGNRDAEDTVLRNLAQLFVRLPGVQFAPVLARGGVAAHWRLLDPCLDRHSMLRLHAAAPDSTGPAPAPAATRPVETGAAVPVRSVPEAAHSADAAARTISIEDVRAALLKAMAEASSSPVQEIERGGRLAEDLGFDSLLMADTLRRLSQQMPGLTVEALALESVRTLDDLTHALGRALGVAAPTGKQTPEPGEAGIVGLPNRCERTLDSFPELQAFDRLQAEFRSNEALVPYYLPHDGIISNHTAITGRPMISFSSYNYLGMSEDPEVQQAAVEAIGQYGTSVSAARILSGNRPLHDALEHEIADFIGCEDAVVLVGGHSTNASIVPQVIGEGDIVFHDALAHDSIQQGIKASGAARHSFPHNDMEALGAALARRRGTFRRALICVEGAYSMDGDTAPLPELVALKEHYGAILMVDEAHSIGTVGTTGRGICEATGVSPDRVDILMGTLSKSMASCGGYLGGSRRFIDFLRYNLSGLVFSAGLSPANTAAALASLRVLRREPERVARLAANADYFRDGVERLGLDRGEGTGTPIVPVIYGDSARTLQVANDLYRRGISINPILAPAVAERLTRLRVFVTATHTREDLDTALEALEAVSATGRAGAPVVMA